MKGYYKDPVATAAVLGTDGWLRTGDLGYLDEDGYVFVVGRAKEIIIKAGEKIAPREIDELLAAHPAILEAAVVGVPHPDLGEDVVAYVALRPGLTVSGGRAVGPVRAGARALQGADAYSRRRAIAARAIGKGGPAPADRGCGPTERGGYRRASIRPRPPAGYLAPRTPVERIIAKSWSAVLGRGAHWGSRRLPRAGWRLAGGGANPGAARPGAAGAASRSAVSSTTQRSPSKRRSSTGSYWAPPRRLASSRRSRRCPRTEVTRRLSDGSGESAGDRAE